MLRYPARSTSVLNPTPRALLVDAKGRPYFLWDSELTLAEFEHRLCTDDMEAKAYLVGKLMRQAKPDDVFTFVSEAEIRALWGHLLPNLGRTRPFWEWLLSVWGRT